MCLTQRWFKTVGGFCGHPVKPYPEHLFLNCPYFEGSFTHCRCLKKDNDICKRLNESKDTK